MNRGKTHFLKIAVILIGLTILCLSIFYLPWLANETARMFPEYSYLQYPVLFGLYVTVIPFYFSLYQAFTLLLYIDENKAFSGEAVQRLISIKKSAVLITLIYMAGIFFLALQRAMHPGIGIIALVIMLTSVVIAVFASVLQQLLQQALQIKSENDLTV
ncbi:DUF2975 domain-containing protein [Bacillus alkalicellulosilyticus]|uniref:DUF2975 domain-containing protein n=1 Tax=Alkalihalobacterium alkalicellulosilyticum TaxID=1912214 RepID=UPI000996CCC5|nr:DUF2975 domain-containing protein [Bacillus alkalicellulosilyticus]